MSVQAVIGLCLWVLRVGRQTWKIAEKHSQPIELPVFGHPTSEFMPFWPISGTWPCCRPCRLYSIRDWP